MHGETSYVQQFTRTSQVEFQILSSHQRDLESYPLAHDGHNLYSYYINYKVFMRAVTLYNGNYDKSSKIQIVCSFNSKTHNTIYSMYFAYVQVNCRYHNIMDQNPNIVPWDCWGLWWGFDMKSCPKSGKFDKSTSSDPLLSPTYPIWGVTIVELTIDSCMIFSDASL